jgi:hypothetical protein
MRTLPIVLMLGLGGVGVASIQLGACGSPGGSKVAGEACHASSECGPTLVCDFSQTPAVCAGQGPSPPDAAVIDGRPGAADAKPKPDGPVVYDAHVDATVDATVDAP